MSPLAGVRRTWTASAPAPTSATSCAPPTCRRCPATSSTPTSPSRPSYLEVGCPSYRESVNRGTLLSRSGGLDQLDQYAARVFGMDEVDPGAGGAEPRFVVEQPEPARAQVGAGRVEIRNGVRELLDARP